MDRRIETGQHLAAGFEGLRIPAEFAGYVRSHKIGNVILFTHNVESKEQLRRLCGDLTALITEETGYPPFITIDQEGGAVSRLREDCAVFPSAMALSATGDERLAYDAGRVTGLELRALGVNFNLAPVMDVNSNPLNPVIGVRSYGDTPERVARFGTAVMRGLLDGGVCASLKHFPGHGDTAVDSHLGLPKVDKTLDELLACELAPFRQAIAAGAPAVMTTHILFPKLEPDGVPATMSRRIITGLLKERLGFTGLVISDCMMMDAIAKYFGTVRGCVAAILAGVDLVFTSHSAALAAQVTDELCAMERDGRLDADELHASTQKILERKAHMPAPGGAFEDVGCEEHRALSARATREALTLVRDAPFALGERPMFLGCRRFRPTLANSPEEEGLAFPAEMRRLLGGDALVTPQDPTDAEIAEILAACAGHSAVAVGTYNGGLRAGQLALVKGAAQLGVPVACVALRNPYDLAGLPANVHAIAAYDYDERTLPVVAKALAGRMRLTGTLPVALG